MHANVSNRSRARDKLTWTTQFKRTTIVVEKNDIGNDIADLPDPQWVARDATDEGLRVDYFRPHDAANLTVNTSRIAKAISIAAVIIGAAQLYRSRYVMSGLGTTNDGIVVDTWLWRASLCHEGAAMNGASRPDGTMKTGRNQLVGVAHLRLSLRAQREGAPKEMGVNRPQGLRRGWTPRRLHYPIRRAPLTWRGSRPARSPC